MVLGMMCGRIVSISYLIFKQRKNIWKAVLGWNSRNNLKMAKRYGSFPKHSVIATLTGSLSANVHLFLFLSFYGDIIVGIIALATRLILNPLGVISTSFSQVFYKKLAGIDNFLDLRSLYIKSILGLTAIALIVISVMYVLPRNFIGFVLGNEWSDMLLPLQIIVWWFAVQFVAGSVSVIFTRLEKESYIFYIQALNLALSVSTLVYAHSLGMSSEGALSLFVVAKVILYIVVMVFPIIYLVRDDKKIS
jgi:O-antigen/teichoic acid export membrane protein